MAAPSDIDPHNLHTPDAKPKRRKKARSKPAPSEQLKAGEDDAIDRAKSRPLSPGVMLEPAGEHGWQYSAPHSDPALWEVQLADAFGTRSQSVIRTFMQDLKRLCARDWDPDAQRWKRSEAELNAALAFVADIQPANVREAALAAQMVAVHWMQMRLSAQALNNGAMVMEKDAALASKLARTFADQLDTLRIMRGGRAQTHRQEIIVKKELHQHVHYHRGTEENDGQSHGTEGESAGAGQSAERAALPSPREVNGEVLPFARDARQACVQDSRWQGRRAEGKG